MKIDSNSTLRAFAITACVIVASGLAACVSSSDTSQRASKRSVAVDTAVNCNGTRVWGPLTGTSGTEAYLSEAGGFDVAGCVALWEYIPARNCSGVELFNEGEIDTEVQSDGSLNATITTDSAGTINLPVADITLTFLNDIPDC